MVKRTIKFRGRTYYHFVTGLNKSDAERHAKRLRKNGYKARIQVDRVGVGWSAYSNPDTPHWYSTVYLKKRK